MCLIAFLKQSQIETLPLFRIIAKNRHDLHSISIAAFIGACAVFSPSLALTLALSKRPKLAVVLSRLKKPPRGAFYG